MSMREVRVTGGFNDPLITDVDLGDDLAAAIAKGALVAEGAPWPARDADVWELLELVDGGDGTAVVSQLVDEDTPAGHYHWWLHLQAGALNLLLRVRDPEDPELPWHIWVH